MLIYITIPKATGDIRSISRKIYDLYVSDIIT